MLTPPPPYGQPDRKISVFFLTTFLTLAVLDIVPRLCGCDIVCYRYADDDDNDENYDDDDDDESYDDDDEDDDIEVDATQWLQSARQAN